MYFRIIVHVSFDIIVLSYFVCLFKFFKTFLQTLSKCCIFCIMLPLKCVSFLPVKVASNAAFIGFNYWLY